MRCRAVKPIGQSLNAKQSEQAVSSRSSMRRGRTAEVAETAGHSVWGGAGLSCPATSRSSTSSTKTHRCGILERRGRRRSTEAGRQTTRRASISMCAVHTTELGNISAYLRAQHRNSTVQRQKCLRPVGDNEDTVIMLQVQGAGHPRQRAIGGRNE